MASDSEMMEDDTSFSSSSSSTSTSSSSSPSSSSSISTSSSSSPSSSSSNNSAKPTITTTTSNKRKLMLVVDGYDFQLKNYNHDRTLKFWRCANRTCRVLVHTNIENQFKRYGGKLSRHDHLPNPSATEVRNLREKMRRRAEKETTSLQKIAEEEVRQALLTGEALAVLPRINNLGHNLVHHRLKVAPPIPQSPHFAIPESYSKDYNNKDRLLLYDSDDLKFQSNQPADMRSEGRILIWSSDIQLNLLFNSEKLHMDGTFSTSPPQFDQVFIIQAFLHGSSKLNSFDYLSLCNIFIETGVPVVYALLPNRKTPTYVHLFNILFGEAERLNKRFDPKIIMTDFEPGLTKAITMEFAENTVQKGCFFHFTKAVYRHVQSDGLASAYLDNIAIRTVIRQMMALALVPVEFVSTLFNNLVNGLAEYERDELSPLIKYFDNYWLRRTSMWNVFDVSDRTNNFSEGYNNRFSNRLEKSYPNIWYFIDAIRKEIDTIHSLIIQINSGMCPRTKRLLTRIAEDRTKELYDRFSNNTITVQELLEKLSFFVPNE